MHIYICLYVCIAKSKAQITKKKTARNLQYGVFEGYSAPRCRCPVLVWSSVCCLHLRNRCLTEPKILNTQLRDLSVICTLCIQSCAVKNCHIFRSIYKQVVTQIHTHTRTHTHRFVLCVLLMAYT